MIVTAGDLMQIDEVHSGRGYQSHYGTRLHFGLGWRDSVDRLEVRWIGGHVDVLENVAVDRLVTVTEGSSPLPRAGEKQASSPLPRAGEKQASSPLPRAGEG